MMNGKSGYTLLYSLTVQFLLVYNIMTNSFNIDTNYPKRFQGPFGSYFGYTVALITNNDGEWVLVGAPKADDSSLTSDGKIIPEPGMLLKCSRTGPISCDTGNKVPVYKGNTDQSCRMNGEDVAFTSNIEQAWLGVSLDTVSHSDVIVCAHRWKNQRSYSMNGFCYELPRDLSTTAPTCLPALVNASMRLTIDLSNDDSYYNYGMGAMGISATYSEHDVLLGAPGMMDYTGGVVKIFTKNSEPYSNVIQRPRHDKRSGDSVGYSVSSGKYFKDGKIYYATGGPRVGDIGEVYIFSDMSNSLDNSDVKVFLRGEQLGGYFGGVLCTADVNHDGVDDLLVGAPLYSSEQEEGAVYVYLGPLKEQYTIVLHGSNTPSSRFGIAIANLGDLNADSYDDIVVGAPLEDEGVIYIYNGYRDGLWPKFTQRIRGQNIDSRLKNFGSSFSRPLDMDNNEYPDFAVGAYESDMAVLLYTKSLLSVDMTMTLTPEYVNPREQMTLKLCFHYSGGYQLPNKIDLNFSLEVDTLRTDIADPKRAFIVQENENSSSIKMDIDLPRNLESCHDYTVIFKLTPENLLDDLLFVPDLVTPVIFEGRYDISVEDTGEISSMLKTFDGNNAEDPWEAVIRKTALFKTDCRNNNVCKSDLQLSLHVSHEDGQEYTVITMPTQITIFIRVENSGEEAYATQVILYLSSPMTVLHVSNDIICYTSKNNSVTCNIGNPLKTNDHKQFFLSLETSNLNIEQKYLNISSKVVTTSTDVSHGHVKEVRVVEDLKIDNMLSFTSNAIPDTLVTSKEKLPANSNHSQWMYFSHACDFQNLRQSPLSTSFLLVYLSHLKNQDKNLTYIDSYEVWPSFPEAPVPHSVNTMDCDKSCRMFAYHISEFQPGDTVSVTVKYRATVNILHILQQKTQLDISTVCEVIVLDLPHLLNKNTKYSQKVTTVVYPPKPPAKPVEPWVIVISVLGGLAILAVSVFLLWKIGFFRRKKREELLKRAKRKVGLLENDHDPEHQAVFTAGDQTEENNKETTEI